MKQDGWLREDGCCTASFKSGNIWSVNVSQPPSKVEISPQAVFHLESLENGICFTPGGQIDQSLAFC